MSPSTPSLNPYSAEPGAAPVARSQFWVWLTVSLGAGCLGAVCGGAVGFVTGGILGQTELYHRQYEEEKSVVEPILAGDPAFGDIAVEEKSDGGIWLQGSVPTQEDRERLRAALQTELGRLRSEEIVLGVDVGPPQNGAMN